ncbi:MAG: hypothetical protein V7742_23020 [Halioglobus sp.]
MEISLSTPVNPVFDAWVSADLDEMLAVVHITDCRPVDRHYLLTGVVKAAFSSRHKDPKYRHMAVLYCQQYLEEWPRLWQPLLENIAIGDPGEKNHLSPEGTLPYVPVFPYYAKLLVEGGLYPEAIALIKEAGEYPFSEYMRSEMVYVLDSIQSHLKKAG